MTTYQSIPVPPILRPYVREIAVEGETAESSDAALRYALYPDPFPTLGVQYRGTLSVIRAAEEQVLERSGMTGLLTSAREVKPHDQARSVLVRFEPHGAHTLLGCDMTEVADAHVGLSGLLGSAVARSLEDYLADASTIDERVQVVESFLIVRLQGSPRETHLVVPEAARRIRAAGGRQRIETLADDLGVSQRQLERLFRSQVGVGPKRFATLVQFDRARKLLASQMPAATVAVEAGYADQAHFSREFVARSGRTPKRYLAEPR